MGASDLLVVFIGVVLVAGGIFQILRRYIYLKNRCTVQAPGSILDMEQTEKERDADSTRSISYYINYRYYAYGAEYVKRRMVSKRQYKAIGKHDNLNVFYDPSKPKRHFVLELKFRIVFTLGLIAIGAILLYYPIYYGLL